MKPIKILLALMIFYTISLNAQDVINITKGQKQMIGKNILFFVDTTNKLGIHELNHQLM